MRHEIMMKMSKTELDNYGTAIGVDVSGKSTVAKKVAAIEEKRARVADIDVLGMTVHIPVRKMHDKRVTDILASPMDDAAALTLFDLLLGTEQSEELTARATDDDGIVDTDALGYALAAITLSDELKNY